MSNRENRNLALVVLYSLGWPLIWGTAACVGFYALIHGGVIRDEMVRRYFAGRVDYLLSGPLGGLQKPTEIRDLSSGRVIRAG